MSSDLIDIEMAPETRKTIDTLQTLSADLKEKAIRSALRRSAKPVEAALKSVIGGRGRLAGAVNTTLTKPGHRVYASHAEGFKVSAIRLSQDDVGVIVGPNKYRSKYAYIGMILETGAKPHTIGTTLESGLRIGGNFVGKEVEHPGFKGRDIFGKAFRQSSSQVEDLFYAGLERYVNKVI